MCVAEGNLRDVWSCMCVPLQGLLNVAAVSTEINYENKATKYIASLDDVVKARQKGEIPLDW